MSEFVVISSSTRSEAPASERAAPEAPASRDERQWNADEAGASEQCVPGLEPRNEGCVLVPGLQPILVPELPPVLVPELPPVLVPGLPPVLVPGLQPWNVLPRRLPPPLTRDN